MNKGIYTITNLVNGKIYVGYTSNFTKRKDGHFSTLSRGVHTNDYLQKAYTIYGRENFVFEILEECEKEYFCSQEHYWATMLNTHNQKYGYNLAPTHPYCVYTCSCYTKRKLSKSLKGLKRPPISEETRQKLRDKPANRKGVKLSEESKKRISIAKSNPSKETREKISSSLRNYLNINGSPNKGRKQSKEILEMKSLSMMGKSLHNNHVLHIESGEKYICVKNACDLLGLKYRPELIKLRNGLSKIFTQITKEEFKKETE